MIEELKAQCWKCRRAIDSGDNYCRHCGMGQGKHVSYYYRHPGIIALTLCLGPLALYFVWRSPVLSKTTKWIYAVIIGGVSVWLALLLYQFLRLLSSYIQMFSGGGF